MRPRLPYLVPFVSDKKEKPKALLSRNSVGKKKKGCKSPRRADGESVPSSTLKSSPRPASAFFPLFSFRLPLFFTFFLFFVS